ncbi:DUF2344 domain-containing protein [Mobilitalea sibirica]|uniref:DUF2344 domain-containing protein n=1 Tax=Mobilitalea sibirica TaxID=1462919 RepID=A0A8J7KZU4_9FIRM|nr:TIGR03936 family radical SAM-associated protein [Mobilitalea sibirica]MBH1940983.1 DUF2344 domain-containing protein [Mobilitalea sibirica]
MKVRIKFQKYGAMKFIGHLDVMRYFQKAFRRAGVDNEYTKGFSPHQIMSFAAPLGVGLTSDGEYLDVSLLSSDEPEVMIKRMNEVLTEGFRIIGFRFLKDREENKKAVTAMSLVSSADYLVSLKDGYLVSPTIDTQEKFQKAFLSFMKQKEIIIDKKTKKSEMSVDIKPMITMVAFDEVEYTEKLKSLIKEDTTYVENQWNTENISDTENYSHTENTIHYYNKSKPESMADRYDNGIKVYLQLHTGSSANLKPELVLEAFCNYLKVSYQEFAWQMHRLEVYTREEETGLLTALDQLEQ